MLTPTNVTAAQFNTAIKAGKPNHIRLAFTGQDIVLSDDDISANGGVVIRNLLNADTDLTMGKTVMKEVTVYIINSDNLNGLNWEGEFKLETGTEVSDNTIEWITQGWFTGVRPERIFNVDVIQFVAYDRMNAFEIIADDWLNNLTYPMTVRQMYDSLCLYCGITNEVGDELTNIMNRSYSDAPIKNTGLICRDILALIAEAAGCYAKITTGGNLKLVWFASADYSLTGDDEFSIENVDLQSISLMAVDGLNVRQTDDDVGVVISTGNRNMYLIVDNPFLTTNDNTEVSTYIQPIFDRLSGFGGYLPMNVVCIGNPLVEAGDIISVAIGNDTFSLPIFSKTEVFNGALTDEYEATGNMKRKTYSSEIKQKLSNGGKYHILKNNIDELYSELYDPTTGDVSILNQTAEALGLSANGIDIVGGKYIKIRSLNSEWTFDQYGLSHTNGTTGFFRIMSQSNQIVRPGNEYDCSYIQPFGDSIQFYFWNHNNNAPGNAMQFTQNGIYMPPGQGNNEIYNVKRVHTDEIESNVYLDLYCNGLRFFDQNNQEAIYISPFNNGTIEIKKINITNDGIIFKGTKANSALIRFIDNTVDQYGNGIIIGDGGAVIIGAGESADTVRYGANVTGGTEVLYLASDSNVKIMTNVNNGYANRKEFTFGADGTIVAPGRLYQNGNQVVPLSNTWRGYQVKQYEYTYTIPANGGVNITAANFNVSTPPGYTPVAIAYYNTADSNVTTYYIDATATGNQTMIALINKANAQISHKMAIKILYLQTGNP